jgi:hypothetical protein
MIFMTFISMHSVIICVVFPSAYMRCTRLRYLNPGVTMELAARTSNHSSSRHRPSSAALGAPPQPCRPRTPMTRDPCTTMDLPLATVLGYVALTPN